MTIVTTSELQNNFGKYLKEVQKGNEIIIMKNGKKVARLISDEKACTFLSESLIGVIKGDCDEDEIKRERMKKYENIG